MQDFVDEPEKEARKRIADIKKEIAKMDLVCSGTLIERTKTCGKPNCRCATDPKARHGPYYEWTRSEEGRFVHRTVSASQAGDVRKSIANYKALKDLLSQWKRQTLEIILSRKKRKK
jgi:hypothetical protein